MWLLLYKHQSFHYTTTNPALSCSITQLQQTAESRSACAGLEANIATILRRLETIENGLNGLELETKNKNL